MEPDNILVENPFLLVFDSKEPEMKAVSVTPGTPNSVHLEDIPVPSLDQIALSLIHI